ncbi:MAG: flavin-containing monooxygenase [Actinomadura sp.]
MVEQETAESGTGHQAAHGDRFPGDPDHYPHCDEVIAYLRRYAATLDAELRTGIRVTSVQSTGSRFSVQATDGQEISASGVVAASGSRPLVPELHGGETFTGELLHVAAYRNAKPYAGKRVVVVGAGNSAVQIGYELAEVASVTLASRAPVHFVPQRSRGQDVHHWAVTSGFDHLPPAWLAQIVPGRLVNDTGAYQHALDTGVLDRRPMFTALDGDRVIWSDGTGEHVDAVLLATGYLPNLNYLAGLGALDASGMPLHTSGLSLTHPGLAYVGLEFQHGSAKTR